MQSDQENNAKSYVELSENEEVAENPRTKAAPKQGKSMRSHSFQCNKIVKLSHFLNFH